MKISVVVPAYNEEKCIERCLNSLVKQDYDNFEVILCLNNCTDNTENIAKRFSKVKIVKEERKGVTYARQTGTKEASGEIIASADADSYYPSNWLSGIAGNFENSKVAVAYGPVYLESDSYFLKFMSKYVYTWFLIISSLLGMDNVAGINFAFRKKIFEKTGGYTLDLKSAEDIDLTNKLRKFGKVKFDRKLVVYTSGRKFEGRFLKSLIHHSKNYIRVFILKKEPEKMVDIR